MAAFDYEAVQKITTNILTDFNQGVIQLVKITPGTGPSEQPGAPTEVLHTMKGTVKGVSKKYVSAGLAKATDLEVILAVSSSSTPEITDKLIINGERHNIAQLMPKPPSGVVVAYVLIVRR